MVQANHTGRRLGLSGACCCCVPPSRCCCGTGNRCRAAQCLHGPHPIRLVTVVLGWNQQAPLLLRKIASNGHDCSQTLGR